MSSYSIFIYYNYYFMNKLIFAILSFVLMAISTNSSFAYMNYNYPWCWNDDIVIWGQVWASCNVIDLKKWNDYQSGWFTYTNARSLFTSVNWNPYFSKNNTKLRSKLSPCAEWYRLPNQWEWATAENYAKLNNTNIESLLRLPLNGWYIAMRDDRWSQIIDERLNVYGSYWTSTYIGDKKLVYHIWSLYAWYRTNGSDLSYKNVSTWRYEVANIRCIRDNKNEEVYNIY